MARGKPPLWIGWARNIGAAGFCSDWTQYCTGRSREEVRDKLRADFRGGDGTTLLVLRRAWGHPNGKETWGEFGLLPDDDYFDEAPQHD